MGVKGLWKLLDGTGRPVNLESLEGKILAVDISVWLNMAIKGMRDYHGHSSQTAHLTTLFNRICKLLYYGIKPVFVFDGQAPALKQRTLRERRERKNFNHRESKKAGEKILQNYLKKQILHETVGKSKPEDRPGTSKLADEKKADSKPSKGKSQDKDIFDLPPPASQLEDSDQEDLEEELKMRVELQTEYLDDAGHVDIAGLLNMNIDSKDFNSLPSDVQYELLKDLKEIRKRRRTKLEVMPEESNNFSDYQIAGLLAKRKISKKMEYVENRMSEENLAASSQLSGLGEDLTKDHIVDARQLVSDSTSHYIWMRKRAGKEEQKAMDESKLKLPENLPLTIIEEEADSSLEDDKSSREREHEPASALSLHATNKGKSHLSEKQLRLSDQNSVNGNKLHAANSSTFDTDKVGTLSEEPTTELSTDTNPEGKQELKSVHKARMSDANVETLTHSVLTQKDISAVEDVELINQEEVSPAKTTSNALQQKDSVENIPGKVITEKIVTDHNDNPTQEATEQNTAVETHIIDAKDDDSSDEEFLEVPEQDHSSVPVEDETPPEKSNFVEKEVGPAEKKSEEEYDAVDVNPWEGLDFENVENFSSQLDEESKELRKMMQAKERAAKDLSQSAQMECQELLKLFGLPYIISPQEAEAQCATLELLGLTQGTITDDSDIWLFGGKYVIKDMFGNRSDPVAFNVSDIEMQLGLNRDRFICVAMCSGSDYTTGIRGIGPVTAMEILREFEGEGIEGLINLKKWWDQVCASAKQALPSETKIKSQLRRINLRKDFPSQAVYKAYLKPVVDDQNNKFEWGFPDLDELRHFATGTMSWTRQKVDEVLLPVMKKLGQQRSSQVRITQFITPMPRTTSRKRSKRVMRAAAVLTGTSDPDEGGEAKKKRPPRVGRKSKIEVKKEEAEKLNLSESSSDDD